MREVKFRAWVKDYALMADVNFLNIDYKEIVVMINENDYEFNCGEYELMQYTGLKDKNGTEIYEGDILTGFVFKERWTGNVKYLAPYFAVLGERSHVILEDLEECRVIGNIYEHPHLLGD